MPFILSSTSSTKKPIYIGIRELRAHSGADEIIKTMASQWISKQKKVLVFDTTLGLKTLSSNNKNTTKIVSFFQGLIPLSELIVSTNNVDIISGISSQNLNALTSIHQYKIKNDLQELAANYDVVFIYIAAIAPPPFLIDNDVLIDNDETFWVITPNLNTTLETIQNAIAHNEYSFILSHIKTDIQRNNLHLLIKSLVPQAKIVELYE